MALRELHCMEQFAYGINMGMWLTLKGDVCEENLRQAYALTQKEHPALRLMVEVEESGTVVVPADCLEMQLEVDEAEGTDVEGCEAKLAEWIDQPRDLKKSLYYFQYFPACAHRSSHVLLICANHALMDAQGMLHVFASFCGYLGSILDGKPIEEPTPRTFKDLPSLFVKPEGLEKPEIPDNMLPSLTSPGSELSEEGEHEVRNAVRAMSREATSALLATCRRHGFTVQGALCAAQMMSGIKAQQSSHPLPQNIVFFVSANMRQQVSPPLDPADCASCSSMLWWPQKVSADQKLIDVANTASKEVRRLQQEGFGLGFWEWSSKGFCFLPATVTGTTLGVVPIQDKYGSLEVQNLNFTVGMYGSAIGNGFLARYLYTFAGSLRLCLGYSWPSYSNEDADEFLRTEMQCLEVLAGTDSDTMTVGSFLETL